MKGVLSFTPVVGWVHQGADDLKKFDDRSWPTMRQNDWQSAPVLRSDVDEVNPKPVNFSAKLGPCIKCSLNTAPIVLRAPIFNQRLRFRERYALRPVSHRLSVGPTSIVESLLEILQRRLWYMNLEGRNVRSCRSTTWEGLPTFAWTIVGKRPAAKSPAPPDAAATRMKLRREHIGIGASLVLSSDW